MSWLTGQHGACTYICPEHRYVSKSNPYNSYLEGSKLAIEASFICPRCRKALIDMGTKWRAPKKKNNKAWTQINQGNIWWDNRATVRTQGIYNSEYCNAHLTKCFIKQMAERNG